jgi:hypothetical protein
MFLLEFPPEKKTIESTMLETQNARARHAV